MSVVNTVRFNQEDMDAFRRLSHDNNPLHSDDGYASRTPFGNVVVYGVLGTLGALRSVLEVMPIRIVRLKASFPRPLFIGEAYDVTVEDVGPNQFALGLVKGGVVKLQVELTYAQWRPSPAAPTADGFAPTSSAKDLSPREAVSDPPRGEYELATPALASLRQSLGLEYSRLPVGHLAALCWSSYFVGMEFPGQRALFAELDLSFVESANADNSRLAFSTTITAIDEKIGIWSIQASLSAAGTSLASATFLALRRPSPVQYSYERLGEMIGVGRQFEGKVTLVTGGSRGLGSLLAVGCALRGSDIALHYHRNEQAAAQVCEAIKTLGRKAYAIRLDLRRPRAFRDVVNEARNKLGRLDIAIHNAFAPIIPMQLGEIGPEVVEGIGINIGVAVAAYQALIPHLSGGTIVHVSSQYTVTPPSRGSLAHYVAAKSGIEGLSRALAAEYPAVRFVTLRPPKILTDQTNSNIDLDPAAEPYETAAALIRILSGTASPSNYIEIG